jgi:hypothetical protein
MTATRALIRGEVSHGVEMVGRVAPLGGTIGPDEASAAECFAVAVRSCGAATVTDATLVLDEGPPVVLRDVACTGSRVWLMDYGWRARDIRTHLTLLLAAHAFDASIVDLYQPRARHPDGPWREYGVAKSLTASWAARIGAAAAETVEDSPRAWPGHHCAGCGHRSRCPALRAACHHDAGRDDGMRPGVRAPADVIGSELEHAEAAAACAEARLSGLRAETEARIRSGEWIPGWYLKHGVGHREFTVPASVVAMMTGCETERTVRRSPAELERDGASRAVLDGITRRPQTAARLARLTEAEIARIVGATKRSSEWLR